MDTSLFIVSHLSDPTRSKSPWKLEIKRSFAGKKIRRFFALEAEAWDAGLEMVGKIRSKGTEGLQEQAGLSMRSACATFRKKHERKSKSHKDKANQICDMLEAQFVFVDVAPSELDAWFTNLPGSETTRAMFFRYVRMFFRWAHRMGYIQRDPSAALDAPKASVGRNILTVPQMTALVALDAPQWLKATILLGGFAGLRTEEMLRMNWEDIDVEAEEIHIRPGVMKDSGGFFERIVDFTEPLKRRKDLLTGTGKIAPVKSHQLSVYRGRLCDDLGWPAWPDNCLRHSFATYHLAQSKDPGKTAHQMGHSSPAMVRKVYAVPARRADASGWWAI